MQGAASFIGTRGKTVADAYPERYLYYQGDAAKIRVKTARLFRISRYLKK